MTVSPDPPRKKQDRPPRRHWQAAIRPHTTEIVLAILLFAVGCAQVIIYNKQAGIMDRQAEISARQLAATLIQDRPWVSVDIGVGNVSWSEQGVRISFRFQLQNSGHSPAMSTYLRYEIVPLMAASPAENWDALLSKISDEERARGSVFGFPLFPNSQSSIYASPLFSTEKINAFFDFEKTFGSPTNQGEPPASHDWLQLVVVFVVDYIFQTDGKHHQYRCVAKIVHVDLQNPNGNGGMLKVGENLVFPQARADFIPADCKAD